MVEAEAESASEAGAPPWPSIACTSKREMRLGDHLKLSKTPPDKNNLATQKHFKLRETTDLRGRSSRNGSLGVLVGQQVLDRLALLRQRHVRAAVARIRQEMPHIANLESNAREGANQNKSRKSQGRGAS